MRSLFFFLSSVWNLGPRLGFRYWRIYRQCLDDPSTIVRWERKCRWEAAQVEGDDPGMSKFLDDWADILSRCPGGSLNRGEEGEAART